MSTKKKLLQAAAGSAGGAGLDVDEVFSTYLYTGDNNTRTITNNIDFSGEGGLLWIQNRSQGGNHHLFDTERGSTKNLHSNRTDGDATSTTILTSFNSNGYSIGTGGNSTINNAGDDFVAWSWRKAPKFFDVVTYTGNGANRTISHSLNSEVGFMVIKRLDSTGGWIARHRTFSTNENCELNNTNASFTATGYITSTTSTTFTIGNNGDINQSGSTYVAYLWAHNNSDGTFGPDSDQDIIKCGSFSSTSTGNIEDVTVGFEPQWLLLKKTNDTSDWWMADVVRGMPVIDSSSGIDTRRLFANRNNAESDDPLVGPTPNGFRFYNQFGNSDFIYIAIRRGSLAEPTSATDVFAVDQGDGTSTDPQFVSGFVTDFALWRATTNGANWETSARLINRGYMRTNSTNGDLGPDGDIDWDYMNGHYNSVRNTSFYSWMWKRAPGFFDVATYTGNGTAGKTVNHNLGVEPEMIWVKARSGSEGWNCYFKTLGNTYVIFLNKDFAAVANSNYWNSTTPTATQFTLGTYNGTNQNNTRYIAFLFATLAGISKVGSFSGNNANDRTIDCGFSNGAKLVIIKCTSNGGTQWFVFDSVRGISASGNDPYMLLNSDIAQQNSLDLILPASSGFAVNYVSSEDFNETGKDYIFYAVAT